MADIKYLDEDSIRQLITLIKTSNKDKLEVKKVTQLPTTGIQTNVIYLIENGASDIVKNCEAYLYLNSTIGWIKISGNNTQLATMPIPGANNVNNIIQYIGDTNNEYIHGYFYECIETGPNIYNWTNINTQDGGGESPQVTVIPTPNATNLNKVVQYIGDTTTDYIHGYFYKCVYENEEYKWLNIQVQDKEEGIAITTAELAAMWD